VGAKLFYTDILEATLKFQALARLHYFHAAAVTIKGLKVKGHIHHSALL